jgi:uncharacterized membrane protein
MGEDQVRALARRLLDIGLLELSPHEQRIIETIARRHAVSRDISKEFEQQLTFGERLSDRVAEIGGSWAFLIAFGIVLVVWMGLNSIVLVRWGGPFDPYPYIFLNFILSLLAAVQAPIIMMSQNRQADKDRMAAAHDYEVNLKAEIEIMALHDKLDQIRTQELRLLIERLESAVERTAGRPSEPS